VVWQCIAMAHECVAMAWQCITMVHECVAKVWQCIAMVWRTSVAHALRRAAFTLL